MEEEKKIVPVPNIENREEMLSIKRKFNIPDDRWDKGVLFAHYITEGHNKVAAYELTTGCNKEAARRNAGSLFKGKWIQELIRFMSPDDCTLYVGETRDIIAAGMEIIRDRGSSNREKSDAMKALQPYIKAEKLRLNDDLSKDNQLTEALSFMSKVVEATKELATRDKMVSSDGRIVDVEIIE